MVRHIDTELQELKDLVLQMGGCVETAIDFATGAVFKFSVESFAQLEKQEEKINDLQIRVDEAAVNLLAKQAPVARDLRMVIAMVKINTDLERMGDQAINIGLSARDYAKATNPLQVPPKIREMVGEVKSIVRASIDSFARQDVDLAQVVLTKDDRIDQLKDEMVKEGSAYMTANPGSVECYLSFIMTAKNLERVADHATNIAEEVIYLATGADVRHGHSIGAGS